MPLDLTSVRAKLSRSAEHAQTIKDEMVSLHGRNPYSVIQKTNADSSRYSLILRINERPPMQRWSLIFGDYLSNLRASLDHLVYAIACHESASTLPPLADKLMFPITDSRTNFDEAVKNRKRLGNITDPVRTKIESFQPYNRRNPDLPPLLSIIRDLHDSDKHKLLGLAYGAVAAGELGFFGEVPAGRKVRQFAHSGEVEDGTEVYAITFDPPTPNMKWDKTLFHLIVAVRHGKRDASLPDGSERSDIISVMNLLSLEVRQIIYDVSASVI